MLCSTVLDSPEDLSGSRLHLITNRSFQTQLLKNASRIKRVAIEMKIQASYDSVLPSGGLVLSVTFGIQRRSVIFLGKDSFVLNFAQPTICDEAVLRSGLHRHIDADTILRQ